MVDFEIGDWIKVIGEEDYYNIKSVDVNSGYVEIEDVSGHTWYTAVNTIKRKCTNKEIYGVTEKTTADEYNKRDYGPPYGPHNPTGNEKKEKDNE